MLLVTGCNQVNPATSGDSNFDLLGAARPIPPLVAQLQSLDRALEDGLSIQSVADLHTATLTVEDFYGEPFVHVTFTSPVAINDLWTFASTLSGDEWTGDDAGSPWTITITGASTARYPQSMNGVGLETLIDFRDTIAALGGPSKLKRVVAAMSTIFLLEDTSGTYWDPNTHAPANSEWLTFLKDNYDEMMAENNSAELQEQLDDLWEPYLEGAGNDEAVLSPSLHPDLARGDGTLNLKRAAELLQASEKITPQVRRTPTVTCEWVFGFQRCYDLLHGYINPWDQAHSGAFEQRPYFHGWKDTHKFTMNRCRGGLNYDAPIGCAPAAFISLIWRLWADGEPFYGKRYNGEPFGKKYGVWQPYQSTKRDPYNKADSIAVNMTMASSYYNRPVIASYMGSCYFGNGTMTLGQRFVDGGNDFLKDQGKQASSRGAGNRLRMGYNFSKGRFNVSSAPAKATILHRELGQYNRPVIAEYWLDKEGTTKSGHFSPVTEYRVFKPKSSRVWMVRVKTMDTPSKWYTLTDAWQAEVGVYYVERY